MEPTPKQAERLGQLETAVQELDALAERGRFNKDDLRSITKTVADSLESLRILVAQAIDAL